VIHFTRNKIPSDLNHKLSILLTDFFKLKKKKKIQPIDLLLK